MSAEPEQPAIVLAPRVARRFEAIIVADAELPGDLCAAARAASIELVSVQDTSLPALGRRLRELWQIGIGPAEVLGVGPEPGTIPKGVVWLSGGYETLAAIVADQTARRGAGELPLTERDPTWTLLVNDAEPQQIPVHEGLLTLADGRLGTRGSVLVSRGPDDDSGVLMAGVYTGQGPETQLLDGPSWNTLSLGAEAGLSGARVLNLRAGTLTHQLSGGAAQLDALLLSSLARPSTTLLRARGSLVGPDIADPLRAPAGADVQQGVDGDRSWMRTTGSRGSIVAARHARVLASRDGGERPAEGDESEARWVLDRTTSYESNPDGMADEQPVLDAVGQAAERGFDALFAEHRRSWAARWEDADVAIEGDTDLQRDVRLALFHLIASVTDRGEAAVGARGLSGSGYRGHVFWDSDVYVLPFMAATHPESARAMLEYRARRLPVSLAAARALGRRGARFAWESAASGEDITPASAPNGRGGDDPVYTGPQEEHIVADVAWAAAHYIDWTGDKAFAAGPGLQLIVQTARWWASRIERDADGSAHIRGVMGPDEYHEGVDDDAYTNVMARWNLRRAAGASAGTAALDWHERAHWIRLAEALADGYDPATGIYEQFAGWGELEPVVLTDLLPQLPASADAVLGHARVRSAQIVKQPDVLMLHYLIPEELAHGSLAPNLAYYDPRTAHGSSLSMGVHAALMARAGELERAVELLRMTTRVDLDDIGGESAQGVHLAAMGSVWRAVALGFVGLRPVRGALAIDPVLPAGWESLKLQVSFHGSRVRVSVRADRVEVSASRPVSVLTPTGERVMLGEKPQSFPTRAPAERKLSAHA